jgi:hypothetical protein
MQADSVAVNQPKHLAADDDDRASSAPGSTPERAEELAPGGARIGRVAALRIDMHRRHLRRRSAGPGTMPARNSAPIEVEITPPHTIIRIEGGMMTASTADTAVMATEKLSS